MIIHLNKLKKIAVKSAIIVVLIFSTLPKAKGELYYCYKSVGVNANFMGRDYFGTGINYTTSFLFLAGASANLDYYKSFHHQSEMYSLGASGQFLIFTAGVGILNQVDPGLNHVGLKLDAGIGILPFINLGASWQFIENSGRDSGPYFYTRISLPIFFTNENMNGYKSIFHKGGINNWW